MNCKRKSRRRFFLLMRSRTPPISTEFRLGGGLNPPNHPLATPLQKIILIAHKLTDGQTGHSTCLVSLFITLVHNCPLPLTTRVQLAVSVPNQVRRKQKGICKTTELVPILCTGELAQIDRNWLQQILCWWRRMGLIAQSIHCVHCVLEKCVSRLQHVQINYM